MAKSSLLRSIFNMTKVRRPTSKSAGYKYEYVCANLLRKKGFKNVNVTSGSGDQGVDVIAYRKGLKYAIQCKYYSSPVGNKAVQEVYAGMRYYNCNVGVVMTNNTFTDSARKLANSTGIKLWPYNNVPGKPVRTKSKRTKEKTKTTAAKSKSKHISISDAAGAVSKFNLEKENISEEQELEKSSGALQDLIAQLNSYKSNFEQLNYEQNTDYKYKLNLLLDLARKDVTMINHTKDILLFEKRWKSLIFKLKNLSEHEYTGWFEQSLPSSILRDVEENKSLTEIAFIERSLEENPDGGYILPDDKHLPFFTPEGRRFIDTGERDDELITESLDQKHYNQSKEETQQEAPKDKQPVHLNSDELLRFAYICNAELEHQDEMEQYGEANDYDDDNEQ